MTHQITNAVEFERLMLEVDQALQARNLPIVGRGLGAYQEVARRLQCDVFFAPKGTPAIPGNYTGLSLSAHIEKWIDDRYGNRLSMDLALGYSVVMIRGDAWLLRIPVIFGNCLIVVERDLAKRFPNLVVNKPGQPQQKLVINLLQNVQSLPQGLASLLTDDECQVLLKYFMSAYENLRLMEGLYKNNALANAARADLTTSARHTIAGSEELGLARWASLQAAEKFLKFYLSQSGMNDPPRTHNLEKLLELANAHGLKNIRTGIVGLIQCDAGVRYEQRQHNLADVVESHQAAIEIGCSVIKTLVPIPL